MPWRRRGLRSRRVAGMVFGPMRPHVRLGGSAGGGRPRCLVGTLFSVIPSTPTRLSRTEGCSCLNHPHDKHRV